MAENTTDETVNFNSEDNNQGSTNPKDRRTGYSNVNELLRANYANTMRKGATSASAALRAAMASKSQKEPVNEQPKKSFTMDEVAKAATTKTAQVSEKQAAPIVEKSPVFVEKPVKPTLKRVEKKIPTLDEFQQMSAKDVAKYKSESRSAVKESNIGDTKETDIAIENTIEIFKSQLSKDAPNRDFLISNVKNNIENALSSGNLKVVKDENGFPIVKNKIDGFIDGIIEGYRQTKLRSSAHDEYFSLNNKEKEIAYLKGMSLKKMETVGPAGRSYPEKYNVSPIDPFQGAIQTEAEGLSTQTGMGIGQVVYDQGVFAPLNAIPVVGQKIAQAVSSAAYGKMSVMEGIQRRFYQAVENGLSDEDAYEIANKKELKILDAAVGSSEGFIGQRIAGKVIGDAIKPSVAKSFKSFGQAFKAFVKDGYSTATKVFPEAVIDSMVAMGGEKIKGGTEESIAEEGKMEFLVNMALLGLGKAVSIPKYVKSYSYNALSTLNEQDVYNKGIELEQQGALPEGTAKSIVEDVKKFSEIKSNLINVKEENVPAVAGLLMKQQSLKESLKSVDPSNTGLLQRINDELEMVRDRVEKALNATDPLSVEYDENTGINIKYKENATKESQGQKQPTEGDIIQRQGVEGQQAQTTNEADNRNSNISGQTEVKYNGTVAIDGSNYSDYNISNPSSPRDYAINSAGKIISALSSLNPGLNVVVFDDKDKYGNALVDIQLKYGNVSKDREAQIVGSNGAYDKQSNTIYLNGEMLNKRGKTTTLFHEGAHPVINAIASSSPEAINNLYKQLGKLSEDMFNMGESGEIEGGQQMSDAIDDVINWADSVYRGQGDDTIKSEAIVEFIANVADGKIKLPSESPIVMKNIIDMIKGFLDIIGMPIGDIKDISDIENIASKIKEAFETGKRIEVSTVKNKNGEITLYDSNVESGEIGTPVASGVVNPEVFNPDRIQTDAIFQKADINWNEFQSDGSFDLVQPEQAIQMYDALVKSGGAIVVTNSDATGIGLSKSGYIRQGGIGFTFIDENINSEIGFAASDDSKIQSFYKAIVDAKDKRDAAFPTQKGKPVAVFVMVQTPTAMFGNGYGADYFANSLEFITRNKGISTRAAKSELISFINDYVSSNQTGTKYSESFAALVDVIKKYDMSTQEGMNAIDQLMITNRESDKDMSAKFGFDVRRNFLQKFFLGEGSLSKNAPAYNLRTALKEGGFYIGDFINEYGDENVVRNLTGKNNTERYMNDGGFAMTGFYVDPYMSQQGYIQNSNNRTFQHRQFNSGFHGINPFVLNGKYYVNEAFPEARFVSKKPGSEGKEVSVATSAAGSMYPRSQKAQDKILERFEKGVLLQGDEGSPRRSAANTKKEANRTQEDVAASFKYDSKKKERAQNVIKNKVEGKFLDKVNRELLDNQALTRSKLRDMGERGAIVEALLTTARGYGAQASLLVDDVNAVVYEGLSEKQDIDIAGVKFSQVELVNEIMNQRRMIAIQGMLKDNFDKFMELRKKLSKSKSEKNKAKLESEIKFIEDYLTDRKVLGKKYNPQTKTSEYYLQNYQVGSTVDANGKTVANNAEMAKKKLAVIEDAYEGYSDLEKRANYMFLAYKGMLADKYENGLIDEDTYNILSKYDYVPISYIEHILNDEVPGYSKVTTKNPNQMSKSVLSGGADGDVLTDFKAILDLYANNHFKNVFNNRASVGLADLASEVPNNGLFELVQSVKDEDGNEVLNPDGNPRYPSAPEGKGYIYYYDNGKRRAILTDLVIANEWYEAGKKDQSIFDAIGKATLAPFTQALLTGKNAAFGVYQMALLDPLTVIVSTDVFSPSVPVAYAQIASGWKNAVVQVSKTGADYRRAASAGAFTQMYAGKELESSLEYEGRLGKIGKATSEFLDKIKIGKVTDVTEKATRLIVFLKAEQVFTDRFVKENGKSPDAKQLSDIRAKAAHEARRSADFARGGNTIKPLSKAFLYLNSTAQTGAAVLAQIKKNPARFIYQTGEFLVMGGAVQAISAGLVKMPWEDEEELKKKQEMYKALSDYTKLNYLNIYVGGDTPEEAFVKIPLPPVIKNIWATGMMATLNGKMNANFTAMDFVKNGLAVNPFGDVEGIITKLPPLVNALLAYSFNFDPFRKDLIVDDEKSMVDYLEGYKDKDVPGFVVSTGKNLKDYGIDISSKRATEGIKKIVGDPSRNPMFNIPKVMFETAVQAYTGAPIKIKDDFEKDWKKPILDATGLSKRIYSGSYRYYESRAINEIAELENMKENLLIEQAAKGSNSKEFKELSSQVSNQQQKVVSFISEVKSKDEAAYGRLVELNKKNQEVISKGLMRKSHLQYINDVFGPKYLELAKIPKSDEKAQRIYDMASNMSPEESYNFFTNVVKLKIMTPSVAMSYKKISEEK
jgi:hypothetical protein